MAISTVGATARNYVDLAAWLADLPATLTEQEVAELYNDAEFTSSAQINISGITTTASNNLVIRAATGEAFNDTEQALRYNASNGVGIRKTSSYGFVMNIEVPHTKVSDIQLSTTGSNNTIALDFGTAATIGITFDNCIVSSSSSLRVVNCNSPVIFTNTCFLANHGSDPGTIGARCGYAAPEFYNCTFVHLSGGSTSFGIDKQGGSADSTIVKNCAIFGFGTAMETGAWGAGTDYNATDNATLPAGSNNQTSLTAASQFEDLASEATLDLRLKAGNSLDGAGTPDSANTNDLDIFGNARSLTSPSIGAYETVSGGGGETLAIDSGIYTLSGTAIALQAQFTTTISNGAYSLSGTATALRVDANTIAGNGSYTLTGTVAALKAASNVIAENGAFNLTGSDVTLTYTPSAPSETLTIDSGVFSLTGSTVGLITDRKTQIDSGSYSLSGQDITLTAAVNTVINSGSYSLTGSNLSLQANHAIIPTSGTYDLSGTSVILRYSGDIIQTIGTVTAGFVDSEITTNFKASDITTSFKVNSITVNFKG